ncbi:hypothetical protein I5M27_10130 [Adhaeribacter sp. BT258]|uniref:DUF4157 domain-containing protein n=1 Tax=Adhaeribacter terrigena TaxID=2793070 RepID=A0ABS1C1R7_9BACT|nr:hypothetical protein [Adhaeribacter terrigena]MBK0403344.1 hypothetical protein [Adhaeribacter terrigena]
MHHKIQAAGAHIVEHSWLARIARWVLKTPNVAMVLGRQIHLSGVKKEDFLKDRYWVEHELCHVQQYKDHGLAGFLSKYLIESCRRGYYNNKFEAEARRVGRENAGLAVHDSEKHKPEKT